ncbi:hypothetical protein [Streptacidiphilus fuscans]|uniref:Uncharacterized protein n=1 Tax=Streptacidiphilus fuscans TaxID=2789292 RepID=A0A931FFM9_9ACTN|nr:hypothetical protein [Streptacidiphilus fuscans]MBF9071778.1 hypothetical protein [Streptacidiphilus fuscans]
MPRHAAPRTVSLAERLTASSHAEASEILDRVADLDSGPLQDLLDLMCAAAVSTRRNRPAWDRCMDAVTAVQDLAVLIGDASIALAALPAPQPADAAR